MFFLEFELNTFLYGLSNVIMKFMYKPRNKVSLILDIIFNMMQIEEHFIPFTNFKSKIKC